MTPKGVLPHSSMCLGVCALTHTYNTCYSPSLYCGSSTLIVWDSDLPHRVDEGLKGAILTNLIEENVLKRSIR